MWLFRRFRISSKCRRYLPIIFSALFLVSLSTLLLSIPDIHHAPGIDDPRSVKRLKQDGIKIPLSELNQENGYKFHQEKISNWKNQNRGRLQPHQFGRGLLDKSKAYNAEGSEFQFRTTNNSNRKIENRELFDHITGNVLPDRSQSKKDEQNNFSTGAGLSQHNDRQKQEWNQSPNVFQQAKRLPDNAQTSQTNVATSIQQKVQSVVQQTPNQKQSHDETSQTKAENLSNRLQSYPSAQNHQEGIRNSAIQNAPSKQNMPQVVRQEYSTKREQIFPNQNLPLLSASTLIEKRQPNQPINNQHLLFPQPQRINENGLADQQILKSSASAINNGINNNPPVIHQANQFANPNYNAFAQDVNVAQQKLLQHQKQHQFQTNHLPIPSQQKQFFQADKQQQQQQSSQLQQQHQHLTQQQQNQWQPHQQIENRKPVSGQQSLGKNVGAILDSSRKPHMPKENTNPDIFWPSDVEEAIPEAFSWTEVDEWANTVRNRAVTSMTTGTETKCGRPPNQYLEMGNEIKLCARHKDMNYIEIEGELFSYYLSRMLDIKSVPPLVLSKIQRQGTQWSTQQVKLAEANWQDEEIITLMQFLEGFERARIPKALIKDPNSAPLEISSPVVQSLPLSERVYLAQWSDLIVFDYLVGHIDRVTNHQEGSFHHDAKTQNLIWANQPIHNLAISKQTSVLWFFDNETGFRMGYRTLYHNNVDSDKYQNFHNSMLHSICVFRSRTVKKITELYNQPDPFESLMTLVRRYEPLAAYIHVDIPGSPNDMPEIFKERLGNVYRWIEQCRKKL